MIQDQKTRCKSKTPFKRHIFKEGRWTFSFTPNSHPSLICWPLPSFSPKQENTWRERESVQALHFAKGLLAPEKERFDAEGRVCRPVRGTACGVARNPVGDEMAPGGLGGWGDMWMKGMMGEVSLFWGGGEKPREVKISSTFQDSMTPT